MAASGTDILASDYVAIQDTAERLLGTGIAGRGYGQAVQSADVFVGNTITKAQWDALRYDIVSIRLHQDGIVPAGIVTLTTGDVIGYGASAPNNNYATLLATADSNRFQINASQAVITVVDSKIRSTSWSTLCEATLTATFASADQARYFFNSGSKMRFTTTLTGGTPTQQYNAWVNFLNSVATRSFGADTDPTVNYYTLTNAYQIYFQSSASSPYSANTFKLEAKTNVANNSAGTATQLFLKVTLADNYVDPGPEPSPPPGDLVDGTLTIAVDELKASGSLLPSGTFTITSPTYSLSAITGS
jgi:hypothetical protein